MEVRLSEGKALGNEDVDFLMSREVELNWGFTAKDRN
jgi:hypothetical protein